MYRGVDVGFGGYVYSETGMYAKVGLLDVESMHPWSVINMNLFGEYTPRFTALVNTRLAIKHENVEAALEAFDGKLKKYLQDTSVWDALSYALKNRDKLRIRIDVGQI